ncbi:restriction endonuclease subunit S [Tessaracoccus lapidicaptus]|nr:restriction endonuclease subunit S [Tessaracoccus lapidicaptus]
MPALGDLVQIYDGPHATPTRRDSGPYFLNISSLKSGRLDLGESDHVSEEDFVRWTRRMQPRVGDLLFSYETRLGEAALMPDGVRACLGRRMGVLRPDRALLEPRYLLYYFLSPLFQELIAERTVHGATVPRLLLSEMASWPVEVPDLATQTAIADVLGALDDKIAANERVRRAVGELSSVLFASATRDSRTARLGDCAKLNERTLKPGSGSIRYLDISSVGVGEFAQPIEIAWSEAPGRARRGVQNGDIIWSTVRPERRSHALILDPPDDLVCSTGLITITPTKVGSAFLYEATRTQEFVDFLIAGSTGSAYPATNAAVFLEAPIPLPDATVLGEFEAQMGPAWRRAAVAAEESRRLAATRDALLPELMSGRLTVDGVTGGASE